MQQAAKHIAGFEFDSFSVSSFHRLRVGLSAWHKDGAPGAGGREVQIIAARFWLGELREIMCAGRRKVKQGEQAAVGRQPGH